MNPIQYAETTALMYLMYVGGALLVFWWIYVMTVRGIQIFGSSTPDEAEWNPTIDEQIAIARMAKDFEYSKELILKKRDDLGIRLSAKDMNILLDCIEETGSYYGRNAQITFGEEMEIRRMMR